MSSTNQIKLVPENSGVYNATDHPDFMRGAKPINGKIVKNKCQLIYSVHFIDNKGIAYCQSWDCWEQLI
jgi:hypothetical protein